MSSLNKRSQALRAATFELLLMLVGILFVRREIWELHILDASMPHWQEGLLLPFAAIDGAISGTYSSPARDVAHTPAYRNVLKWGTPIFFVLYVACSALCERLNVGMIPFFPEAWRVLGIVVVLCGICFRLWSQMSPPSMLAQEPVILLEDGEAVETKPTETEEITERKAEKPPAEPAPEEQAKTPESEENAEPVAAGEPAVDALMEKIAAVTTGAGAGAAVVTAPEAAMPPGFPSGPHKLLRYPDFTGRLVALCGIPLCFGAWLPLFAVPGIIILLKWHISDQEAFRISQLGEPYLTYKKRTWNLIPHVY